MTVAYLQGKTAVEPMTAVCGAGWVANRCPPEDPTDCRAEPPMPARILPLSSRARSRDRIERGDASTGPPPPPGSISWPNGRYNSRMDLFRKFCRSSRRIRGLPSSPSSGANLRQAPSWRRRRADGGGWVGTAKSGGRATRHQGIHHRNIT